MKRISIKTPLIASLLTLVVAGSSCRQSADA